VATFHFREKDVSLFISLVIISISRLKLESVLTTATNTMMMMRSFTTFLVLFAAKLSPATANIAGYTVVFQYGNNAIPADCTEEVLEEIELQLEWCVASATAVLIKPKFKKRGDNNRRLAALIDDTPPAASHHRELEQEECVPGCECPLSNHICNVMQLCVDSCDGCPECVGTGRRLEEGFLEMDAGVEISDRKLALNEDEAAIKIECRQKIRDYAHWGPTLTVGGTPNHRCLGDHNGIDIYVKVR
jgi:hypothetical protein